MDVLNYTIGREAFENNFGTYYYATKKDSGEECIVLKINETLRDEKFLSEVKDYIASEKKDVANVLYMKSLEKDGEDYYAEYEYFTGKPISFIMSQPRKSDTIKRLIKDIAVMLDSLNAEGVSYGGLTTETVVMDANRVYKLLGVEFFNTEYKLAGNEDLYSSGYADPKVTDYKYTNKSDVYSLGRFVSTLFLAEKFYTSENLPIPDIDQLKPIQASIDKATQSEERFESCTAFADSIVAFKGSCPFTDHGSQIATYAYIIIVLLIIALDFCVDKFGWLGGHLGG